MSQNRLTCSVAIATYKGAKYITEQLRSIEEQTVRPDEVIICDDISPDDTVQTVRNYMQHSKMNIKLYTNETNLGFRKNFEKAISLCTKDIVFLCDQDDVWTKDKVEVILSHYDQDPDLVYAFSDASVTDSDLNLQHDSIWQYYNIQWDQLDARSYFHNAQIRIIPLGFSASARRDFLMKIFPFQADHDGWIAMCAPIFGNIKAIDKKLVFYRRHSNSTSSAGKEAAKSRWVWIRNLFTTNYQRYFVYPDLEYRTFSCVMDYAKKYKNDFYTTLLQGQVRYLETINGAKDRNFIYRITALNKLRKNGLYAEYRGNIKTFLLDCAFMFINAMKRKKNR